MPPRTPLSRLVTLIPDIAARLPRRETVPAAGCVAPSHRLSYRLQNSRFASSPAPGQTVATLLHLEAEPAWVRLIFVNDRPEPWTIDAAAVAPTAALSDGYEPVDADGQVAPHLWQRVSFRAGGGDSEPDLQPAGGPLTLTVPGTERDDGIPRHVLSDWMPVRALPRRDGGHGWLLQARTFAQGSIRFAASRGEPDPAIGRLHRGFVADGDRTAGQPGAPPTRLDTAFACHGLEYLSPTAGATVIGIGDSIIHSSCTTGEVSGFGIRACAMLSRPDFPVSYVSEGFPGRNSLGFAATGLWALETLRPQVAILSAWTQNEEWTAPMADLAFARAVALMDAARRVGCVPMLITTAPVFARHPAEDTIRRRTNERVRALGRGGMPILDIDALWGTGATPNAYRRAYGAGDEMHPNDHACAVAARALVPILQRVLGR